MRPLRCTAPSGRPRSVPRGVLQLGLGACFALGCAPALAPPPPALALPLPADGCMPGASLVEHLDEPTDLGFSAVELLAELAGPRNVTLDWVPPAPNQDYVLAYGPEHGRQSLTLDVRAKDGPLVRRYTSPLLDAPEGTSCDSGTLEVPVEVTLTSSERALNESFDATLVARVPYRGQLQKQLQPSTLAGGLSFERLLSLDPERTFSLGALLLDMELWEGGSRGSLALQIGASYSRETRELRLPPAGPEAPESLAIWPSARECEGGQHALPGDARVLGFSAADVLARIGQSGPRELEWEDGTLLEVALSPEAPAAELCQSMEESLQFDALLRARAQDAGLDLRLPVHIEAQSAGGVLGDISVRTLDSSWRISQLAVDERTRRRLGEYTAVSVDMSWTLAESRDTGELSLRGVDDDVPDEDGKLATTALASGRW